MTLWKDAVAYRGIFRKPFLSCVSPKNKMARQRQSPTVCVTCAGVGTAFRRPTRKMLRRRERLEIVPESPASGAYHPSSIGTLCWAVFNNYTFHCKVTYWHIETMIILYTTSAFSFIHSKSRQTRGFHFTLFNKYFDST